MGGLTFKIPAATAWFCSRRELLSSTFDFNTALAVLRAACFDIPKLLVQHEGDVIFSEGGGGGPALFVKTV